MTPQSEALRVAKEALEGAVKVLELATAGYRGVRHEYILTRMGSVVRATDVIDRARYALSTITLALEGQTPPFREASADCLYCHGHCPHPEACDRALDRAAAVQSVALGDPNGIQHPSTRPRSVDEPLQHPVGEAAGKAEPKCKFCGMDTDQPCELHNCMECQFFGYYPNGKPARDVKEVPDVG